MKLSLVGLCFVLCAFCLPLSAQESRQPITDQNAAVLTQLDPIGRGSVGDMDWSPDGRWLAIQTPIGVWLVDSDAANSEPVLLRVLDTPQSFAFSADSELIAVAGCHGLVPEMLNFSHRPCAVNETHLWNLNSIRVDRRPARTIENGQSNIVKLEFSPAPFWNAPLIAALTDTGVLRLSNGGRSWTLDFEQVEQFAFSPDGSQLVVSRRLPNGYSRYGDTFTLLDVEAIATPGMRDIPIFNIPNGLGLSRIAFSDDGQRILSAVRDGIWSWDVAHPDATPTFDQRISVPDGADPSRLWPTSQDFQRAFTVDDGEARLWIDTQSLFNPTPSESSYVVIPLEPREHYLGFSPNTRYLMTGLNESAFNDSAAAGIIIPARLRLYDSDTGNLALTLTPAAMLHKRAISADETKIAYLDPDHRVHLFAIDEAREIRVVGGFAAETYGVAVQPNGSLIYSSCAITLPTGNTSSCMPSTFYVGEQTFPQTGFSTQAVSPDGHLLVNRQLVFRDSTTGAITREIEPSSSRVWHLDFSPDGTWIAVSGETPYLLPLDDPEGEPIELPISVNDFGSIPWTPAITYSPDGQSVATASYDGMARIWDAHSGELLAVLHNEVSPRSEGQPSGDGIAFSPDGRLIAFGSCYVGDGSAASACFHERVYVYEVSTALARGELQAAEAHLILSGAQDYTASLIFSPDGSLIVGSSSPGGWETDAGHEINVWSARTGELLTVLQAPGATEIAFSPDGRQLYSNSVDGVVYRWGVVSP